MIAQPPWKTTPSVNCNECCIFKANEQQKRASEKEENATFVTHMQPNQEYSAKYFVSCRLDIKSELHVLLRIP
jgi:hypothetical protein